MSQPEALDLSIEAMLDAFRAGDDAAAQTLCQRALDAAPQSYVALLLQGVLHAKRGDYAQALPWFERATEADPAQPGAHNNRGNALMALEQTLAAARAYERAIELGGAAAHAYTQRGLALHKMAQLAAALASFERALEIDAQYLPAHFERIDLLIELARRDDAVVALHLARAAGGDDQKIDFALAALGQEGKAPPRVAAPQAYVRELFDRYAPSFDAHLTGQLEYRAPGLVVAAVARRVRSGAGPLFDIIDLGCGTGLCAPPLMPFKRTLVGVDLSPKMLEQARARQCYDEVHEAEIVAFLEVLSAQFDLAIASDVLNYFGDLAAPLAAVHAALRPGGHFVFTVEASEDAAVVLHRTRRFAHSQAHVMQAALGYALLEAEGCTLRLQGDLPVAGTVFVLRRE